MPWIFNKAGVAAYKSDWSDAASVENAVGYCLDVTERRRDGARLAPFDVERVAYCLQDQDVFYGGLSHSREQAVREFREVFG